MEKKTLEQLKAEEPTNVKKRFEMKGVLDDAGEFEGIANVTGIMDRGGDVIAPGSFKSALPKFLKEGFVAVGHDWDSLPVAYPTSAKDGPEGLKVKAKFHGTKEGQDARTVVKERLDAGLTVGLSVGFRPDRDQCAWFESGAAMWKFCEENNIHDGLDKKSITAWKSYCRLLQGVKELFEYSIVTIPMNQPSTATSAKSVDPGDEQQDLSTTDELPAGKSLVDHLDSVLAAVEGAKERLDSYKAKRDEDNRPVSPERLDQAKAIHSALGDLIELATPKAEPTEVDDELRLRVLRLRASQLKAS